MIWALHGFLGRGADWDPFRELLRELGDGEPQTPDLLARPVRQTPAQWADEFVARVADQDAEPSIIGYSMGGRLALHAMLARPTLFERAILVSTGLGIEDADDRTTRMRADEGWAIRFERDDWNGVIRDWNAQAVFAGAAPVTERREDAADRSALASALRLWSPAAHEPLASRLPAIGAPVLLIAGGRDARYVREAERAAARLPHARVCIMPAAGHRVPWERPGSFGSAVHAFFQNSHHEIP